MKTPVTIIGGGLGGLAQRAQRWDEIRVAGNRASGVKANARLFGT
jgi:hypothetical protein